MWTLIQTRGHADQYISFGHANKNITEGHAGLNISLGHADQNISYWHADQNTLRKGPTFSEVIASFWSRQWVYAYDMYYVYERVKYNLLYTI